MCVCASFVYVCASVCVWVCVFVCATVIRLCSIVVLRICSAFHGHCTFSSSYASCFSFLTLLRCFSSNQTTMILLLNQLRFLNLPFTLSLPHTTLTIVHLLCILYAQLNLCSLQVGWRIGVHSLGGMTTQGR